MPRGRAWHSRDSPDHREGASPRLRDARAPSALRRKSAPHRKLLEGRQSALYRDDRGTWTPRPLEAIWPTPKGHLDPPAHQQPRADPPPLNPPDPPPPVRALPPSPNACGHNLLYPVASTPESILYRHTATACSATERGSPVGTQVAAWTVTGETRGHPRCDATGHAAPSLGLGRSPLPPAPALGGPGKRKCPDGRQAQLPA